MILMSIFTGLLILLNCSLLFAQKHSPKPMKKDKGKFLTKKKTKELLDSLSPVPSSHFNKRIKELGLKGVVLDCGNGEFLDYIESEGRGMLWPSKELLSAHLDELAEIAPGPFHILGGHPRFNQDFLLEIEPGVASLAKHLNLPGIVERRTFESLELIGKEIDKYGQVEAQRDLFWELVVYSGEVIRLKTDGKWVMEFEKNSGTWEPYIETSNGKQFNPWIGLYKEFLEGLRPFQLRALIEAEINKYRLFSQQEHLGLDTKTDPKEIVKIPLAEALELTHQKGTKVDEGILRRLQKSNLAEIPYCLPDGRYVLLAKYNVFPVVNVHPSKHQLLEWLNQMESLMRQVNELNQSNDSEQ